MAPPCDAACMKIIINTGFMAVLAPWFADHIPHGSAHHRSASNLAAAAYTHSKMLTAAGLTASFDGFGGCDQAQHLVAWIRGPISDDASELMDKWTADIWTAIADLAAGKMPK